MHIEDSLGNEYQSINDVWTKNLDPTMIEAEKMDEEQYKKIEGGRIGGRKEWYEKGRDYWDE